MAVVAVWKCDRDGTMFDNKKEAEEYDKMLELAANITRFIEQSVPGIDEDTSEKIGLILAKNRETLVQACKGKPELLLDPKLVESVAGDNAAPTADNKEIDTTGKDETGTEKVVTADKKVAPLVANQG